MLQSVRVEYLAQLQDWIGKRRECLLCDEQATPLRIFKQLTQRYRIPLSFEEMRVAVNGDFISPDYLLKPGDRLLFIPPVVAG